MARRLSYLLALLLFPVSLAAQMRPAFSEVHIGAFDPDAWNGITFDSKAYGQRMPFAIRFGSKADGFVDGDRIFDAVSLVGPHAPDGSYALIGWRNRPRATTITLEWSRINETTVVGRLTAPEFRRRVAIQLQNGEASFHHPRLVHGSSANHSVHPRRATVVNVMKDGVRSASNEPLLKGIPAIPAGEQVAGRFFPLLSTVPPTARMD